MFTTNAQPASAPAVLTVAEACATLRISRWALYKLIRERKLETIKIGRRRLVPATEIPAMIDRLRAEESL